MASQASLDIRGILFTIRPRKNVMQLRGRVIAVRKQRSVGTGRGEKKRKIRKLDKRFFFSSLLVSFFLFPFYGVTARKRDCEFPSDTDLSCVFDQ